MTRRRNVRLGGVWRVEAWQAWCKRGFCPVCYEEGLMPCIPCWQQRQLLMSAWHQGNPYTMLQAVRGGVHIATDKYIRGIDVNRKYGSALDVRRTNSKSGVRRG